MSILREKRLPNDSRTQATAVSEEKEFRKTYFHELPRRQFEEFDTVELVLKCYRGRAAKAPLWLDLEPGILYLSREEG